jgi:hypothetical protein
MYFTVFISYKTNIDQQRFTLSFIPLSKGEISNFHEVVRFMKLYTTEKQRIQWSFKENDFQPIFYFAIVVRRHRSIQRSTYVHCL